MNELKTRNLLHLEDVYKSYGDKLVLDDIDLSVAAGEFCTVVGPSGCGKSTLLRIIIGQERATSGTVFIDGKEVGNPDPTRGIVYQRYSLFPHLTVLENVLLGKELAFSYLKRDMAHRQFRDEAMAMLERVRLADHVHKYPHELSGGMQQRVAIAQTLIKRPKIVMMDEPFGALDPGVREDLQLFLLELWEEIGMTVFFVTHDLEEGVFLGTRLIVLSQYYSTEGSKHKHGAKIVADHSLPKNVLSTRVKRAQEFSALLEEVRREGFDPAHLQHIDAFNLKHKDSFATR
ncbi:MAG: ABC transporter ATP-binding protein [Gammaproteobacteria bacterium]|nr:ABC transporter ATP-binding protein [Gammaproteobacteria bacterium]